MKKIILLIIFTAVNISSQSVLTLDAGTAMGVLTGADLCANTFNGSGMIYGGGTICGGFVAIEPSAQNEVPNSYAINQNYPNPFNPVSTILYQLPEAGIVKITVFDILGREIALLINETKTAGYYKIVFDASGLASGIYIYKIEAGSFVKSMKMSVIK